MLKKESIHFINKNRSLIVCEDNFVYLLPCIQLRNWISNFTISFPNQTIISDNYTIIPLIIQNSGNISSQEISKKVFYSSRHLNRLFNQYLGLSMKSFSRLVRINKSIKLLNNNKTSLMSICNELGFYDIPHFIKDFKIVCGITPQKYRANMSDFYSEIAKF
ncbi:helix-turn-helix domain-containing protein [Clostridioides difficile]|uniref:helix-turn-helix domain-containing protein n=1 Tax=Clostridioides difficile TaxID=1496 RepID=UPI002FCFA17B